MSLTPERGLSPDEIDTSALWQEHQSVLAARCVPLATAVSNGLYSVDLAAEKHFRAKYRLKKQWADLPLYPTTGLLIPYQTTLDGIDRWRVRSDRTEVPQPGPIDGSHHGETTVQIPRYICQVGVPVVPYIPQEVFPLFGDTATPLYIVEAPLKALALTGNGFPAIGLGGVLAGATDKAVLDSLGEVAISRELNRVNWKGRVAYVVFDAGITDNPMVAMGAARLATALKQAGADVRFVIMPFYHPQESDPEAGRIWSRSDQGPDDFLARNGVEAFQALVETAVPADPVARFGAALAHPNRNDAVVRLLGDLPVQAMLHTGGDIIIDQVAVTVKVANVGKRAVQQAVKSFSERIAARAASNAPSWTTTLRRTPSGMVMGTVSNALIVLTSDDRIRCALGYDELREEPVWLQRPPWEPMNTPFKERPVGDADGTRLVAWLDAGHGVRISIDAGHKVIDARAEERKFHRVRDYLGSVRHDGVERVAGRNGPGWLTTYLGVHDSPYVRAVGRMFLIGAVARIRQPGCKLDTMLVLEGEQGLRKSTSVEVLFGAEYFSDQLSEVTTKDASSDLRGKWGIEWSELDNLSRPESSSVKKFITRMTDDYRPAYGRRNIRVPRQCVFVGTTNKGEYLKDETGNRRFWPVRCESDINIEALRRDRDLLWAEAVALYEAHERWWFDSSDPDLLAAAREEQAARRVPDPWEATVAKALDEGEDETTDAQMNVVKVPRPAMLTTTTEFVLSSVLKIPEDRQNRALQTRVGEVMHALGWVRRQIHGGDRYYERASAPTPRGPSGAAAGSVGATTATTATTGSLDSEPIPAHYFSSLSQPNMKAGGYGGDGGCDASNEVVPRVTTCADDGGCGGCAADAPDGRDDRDDDDDECRRRGMKFAGYHDADIDDL
jgi:putative DNA primase/helicase